MGAPYQAFLDTAAAVLLREGSRAAADTPAQQLAPLFFALGRLLPFFERDAAQYAPELRALEQRLT